MKPAEARAAIGIRMRQLRQDFGVSLRRTAEASSWNKGHLSRVERGLTKPSLGLVEWYDYTFGAEGSLIREFLHFDAAVRQSKNAQLRRGRKNVRSNLVPRT